MAYGDDDYLDPNAAPDYPPGSVPPPPPSPADVPRTTPALAENIGMSGLAAGAGTEVGRTPPSVIPTVLPMSRWALTRSQVAPTGPGINAPAPPVPSYGQVAQDVMTGVPGSAQPLTKLGKLLTILHAAGQGAMIGSTQPTFGTGAMAAEQFQNQQVQQRQAQEAHAMNLATQRAQLAMLPEQQEFMRQQMTIAPRTDPETGQYVGNLSEKGYETYLASRNKGIGAATVAAASRDRDAQIAAAAKVRAVLAGKRFQPVSGVGLFDTQNPNADGNPTLVPGSQQGVTITPELAQEYGIPQEFQGKVMSLSNLEGAQRMLMAGAPTVSYSRDPLTNLVTVSERQKQAPAGVPGGPPAAGGPVTGGVPVVPRRRAAAPPTAGGGTTTTPTTGAGGGAGAGPAALDNMAQQLVEGNLDPSQIPRRGNAYAVVLQRANAYSQQKYGRPFDVAQAQQDYDYSRNVQTQNTLKMINGMTEAGGAIDIASRAAQALPQFDQATVNKIFNAAATEFGSTAASNFHTAMLGLADEYSKVMGGGVSSDTGRGQALSILKDSYSKGQLAGAIDIMRQDITARKTALIGQNRYLMRQYGGGTPAGGAQNLPPKGGMGAQFGTPF